MVTVGSPSEPESKSKLPMFGNKFREQLKEELYDKMLDLDPNRAMELGASSQAVKSGGVEAK